MNENILKIISEIKNLGFDEPEDILLYLPIKYHDYTETVSRMRDGFGRDENVFVKVRTKSNADVTYPSAANKVGRVLIKVTDGYEDATISVFGMIWDWKDIVAGQDLYVIGKIGEYNGRLTVKTPKLIPTTKVNQIISQYKVKSVKGDKKKEYSSEDISRFIAVTFNQLVNKASLKICNFANCTEYELMQQLDSSFNSVSELLKALHFPSNLELVDEALFCIKKIHGVKILNDVSTTRAEYNEDSVVKISTDLIKKVILQIPFTLGAEQKLAVWHLMQSLAKPIVTQHLISGDVGCGKTIVYGAIAVAAYLLGKQVTVLLPNLPLASQVANEIQETWPDAGVELIQEGATYKYNKKDKKIIVGTTAIIGWSRKNKGFNTDIFIVDEQQKVGTNQKNSLIKSHTNVIEATATALPRTTILALTGAYSISKIEEPPVKKEITSQIIFKDSKKELFEKVKETVDNGDQVAILYQLKNESSFVEFHLATTGVVHFKLSFLGSFKGLVKKVYIQGDEAVMSVSGKKFFSDDSKYLNYPVCSLVFDRAIIEHCNLEEVFRSNGIIGRVEDRVTDVVRAQDEWERHFPDNTVLLHGGLKDEEKLDAVELAKYDKKKVIISTSMIEIGLTFPKLRLLVVIDPENMGVSTLHQIRGRLARHGGKGLFLMFVNKMEQEVSDDSIQRLRLLERFNKGSQLAEHDTLLRGFGDLSNTGVSQSGMGKSIFIGSKVVPEDLLTVMDKLK